MRQLLTILATLGSFAVATFPTAASACGGFFCNNQPIDQTGERVLFGVHGETVTAHIQIFYAGEAEKFAWVLPLPSAPTTIGVGTDTLFQELEQRTQPRFDLQWQNNNNCWWDFGWGFEDSDGSSPPNASTGDGGGVQVLDAGQVGPYDFVVIEGDTGDAVFKWLNKNGYEQPPAAKDLITTYVLENHKFVAVKLQSDSAVGEIRPLTLEFAFPGSCVPLRLTSIAASDDMDVWVYMLGQHRAVPVNYLHVEVNEKAIDWPAYGNNYREIARDAVDMAGGRAFLTEYAGDTNDMKSVLWMPGKYDIDTLLLKETPWDFVQEMLNQGFPRDGQMQTLIRKHIPKPASLESTPDAQFYNNLSGYMTELSSLEFDAVAFVADIESEVFAPLIEANALFDEFRYMTRMYTVMSPNEMTRDPIFLFNPDLPNVDRVHRATAQAICAPGENQAHQIVVTLADGSQLKYATQAQQWDPPVLEGDADVSAAGAVERMYTSGAPDQVALSEVVAVDKQLDSITLGLLTDTPEPRPVTRSGLTSSTGCTVSHSESTPGALALAALVLAGLLMGRRRSSIAALAVVAACTAAAPQAQACGGFFCNNTPVVQSGERVLFGVDKGTVTTHVQVFYQGEAEKFAWVLPVPAEPTLVGVGTDQLFSAIDNMTRPQFITQWMQNDGCYFYGLGGMDEMSRGFPASADPDSDGDKVQVLQEDSVGPYDYVVIKGSEGEAVFDWLNENGYDQPPAAKDLITTYVLEKHLFVAVKLQSDSATGDIQPITLQYPVGAGCVPLRLTSIAATDDMDVWVYMLGQHRAVPVNYLHVEINERAIDWVRGGSNYKQLAADAVDSAAGRAFLTEYAGDTNDMRGILYQPGMYDTAPLLEVEGAWQVVDKLMQLGFPRTAQMQQVLRTHIPKPASLEELTDPQFYNSLAQYKTELTGQPFDVEALVADIEDRILGPLMEANALFDRFRYMTRMYTSISPEEMLRDPIFQFNGDLPNVSNVHRAIGRATCVGTSNYEAKTIQITLSNGDTLDYEGPFEFNSELTVAGAADAAPTITRMFTSGEPETIAAEDAVAVDKELDSITMALVLGDEEPTTPKVPRTPSSGPSFTPAAGCASGGAAAPTSGIAWSLLLCLGLMAAWRERRV